MNPPVRYFINARDVNPDSITLVKDVKERLDSVLRRNGIEDYVFAEKQFEDQNNNPFGVTCAYLFGIKPRDDFIRRSSIDSSLQEDEEEIGHITIHTWPESEKKCSYTMDLSLQKEDSLIIPCVQEVFPGKYFIKKEHRGIITKVTRFSNGVGREVVGYFGEIGNPDVLLAEPEQWLRQIAEKSKFVVVGTAKRETDKNLSVITELSTSHMIVDYDKINRCGAVSAYTCVDFITNKKGQRVPINDEGDPELGMRNIISYLQPKPHCDNYVISKPLAR